MGMTSWNPDRELMAVRDLMQRVFEEGFGRNMETSGRGERVASLPVDAYTTENEIVVIASVPSIDPDTVNISIEGEALTIEGEIPDRLENVNYLFAERFHGKFGRTLRLNVPIDINKVEANFENGILTLYLPKAEEVKPKQIKVKAKK